MSKLQTPGLDSPLVVNPALSIIRGSDDEIMSRYGSRSRSSYRVTDTEGRGVLADFVRSFSQPQTPRQAASQLDIDEETCAEFLENLSEGSLLIPPEQARYGQIIGAMHVVPEDSDETSVSVLGSGRLADATAAQLSDLLSTEVTVSDDLESAFEDHDFVVVCADRLNQPFFYDADEMARAADRPWHLSYLDGAEIIVGPTFIPGESTNYFDRDTLDEAARTLRFEHQYMASAEPEVPATQPIPLFAAQLAAGWTTSAVAQHLWGQGSFLEDYVLRIDLERMQVIRDRVLRLARNPVTVGSRPDLRHPFI
ncbi:MAG: hypothetical protein ACTIL6_10230 [Brevibacterium aurantiacum]|nr:hypothetical protein [Brevibacterium sp.]